MGHFKKRTMSRAVALAVASLTCGGGWAAGDLDLGGVLFIPQLDVKVGHDDNVFESSTNAQSSTFIETAPSVEFRAQQGLDIYSITLDARNFHYTSTSDANHTNGGITASIHKDFTRKNRIDLEASYERLHDVDAVDGGQNNGVSEPSAYDEKRAKLLYGFGNEDAIAQIDLFGEIKDREYKEREFAQKNSRTTLLGTTLFYRLAPKTRALVEFKREDLAYDRDQEVNGALQQSEVSIDSYLVGLTWDATEKTNGYAKIGRRKRGSSVSGSSDQKANAWEIGISYQPTERALIQLSTSRDYGLDDDDLLQSSFTDSVNTMLSWTQQWTDKISTSVSWSVYDEDVQNVQGRNLKQRDLNEIDVQLDWEISPRLTTTVGYIYRKRDESLRAAGIEADLSDDGFDRNIFSIGVSLSI